MILLGTSVFVGDFMKIGQKEWVDLDDRPGF